MKSKTVFVCRECGNETPRWQGQCPACGAWNSIVEFEDKKAPARQNAVRGVARSTPKKLRDVTVGNEIRFSTGMGELDRVLGGGGVAGSLVLVGGAPGIGSTGALQPQVNIRDIVVGQGACTDSAWATQYHLPGTFAPIADYTMLRTCVETAEQLGLPYHVGNLLSSDRFYGDDGDMPDGWKANNAWAKMGVLAVEMEAAALYMNAARAGKRALAICTVSDQLVRQEFTTSEERQTGFTQMMQLALETAIKLEK